MSCCGRNVQSYYAESCPAVAGTSSLIMLVQEYLHAPEVPVVYFRVCHLRQGVQSSDGSKHVMIHPSVSPASGVFR